MGNVLLLEQNIEGRKERAPLGAASYLFNLTGIIGNILVLHVFRTRINASSNYRIFVIFLSIVDLFTCIAHFVKEINRMVYVYNQSNDYYSSIICKISHYIGNSVGYASVLIIGFIAFERYKKICTPFKPQITVVQSTIISMSTVLLSFLVDFPIYLIHGKRYVSVEDINATRCAIENKNDRDLLPILHLGFVFAAAAIVIIITIVLQIRIRTALVKKARSKQKMRYGVSSISSKSGQETSGSETPKKRSNRAKKSADDQDSERNRRVAIRFAIISMFLIVSFISQTVFQFIIVTKRYFFPRQRISKLEDVVEEYFPDIVALNGILNPFVYLFTDNEFRQELKKMCWRRI